ncbi:hypothetical protein KO519_13395 [Paraglaciecola agarilytica]|jgi:hypothetical protein|uniref:Uncharacterized protein n=2 Tax=Paraglaciecola TaxID=1621534 RepID=A0ABU9SVY4_9ALTE|nr:MULTISPECIES: hypothetical protein [Paraglaciecola]MAD15986.1 hypothetical protein [Alteromonadaceae bacterium]MBB20272.1 hypothetical protein [Rickettsiales bacterium]ABG42591.1 hypothetical protein Patl_4092 [Paraglaciecola sp. T6c]MBJ2138216.1 hypothetical protein [Paraglaciecola chathamensis]MBU3018678.1 hypothetical protein [Paraglaciecola agarilytica]|tara:strand:- start:1561 stop:1860 length:300 start_codon:yes stop_codon:yes gene_type:complete
MTEQTKAPFISFKFDVMTFIALCGAMYLAYTAHSANMENTAKLSSLLSKYEQTLDAAIAGDEVTLKRYRSNIKKTLDSLSPKERELMLALLKVDAQSKG